MKTLYESILSSTGSGRVSIINKIIAEKDFSPKNIAMFEKEIAIWQPRNNRELQGIIPAYIKAAGNKCSLNWIDVSKMESLNRLFDNEFNGDISKWDVSKCKNMALLFQESLFNGDISKWDVSNVTDMHNMFYGAKFNGDISKWDVSNVYFASHMFKYSNFNGDISKWDVREMHIIDDMFSYSDFNRDISKWQLNDYVKRTAKDVFNHCKIKDEYKPEGIE